LGKNHPDIWRVRLVVKLPALEACEAALDGVVEVSSWFLDDPDADETDENTDWCLEGFARVPPDRASLDAALAVAAASVGAPSPVMTIEQLPDTDWVLANLRDFPPISAGRFFVHGSHYAGWRIPQRNRRPPSMQRSTIKSMRSNGRSTIRSSSIRSAGFRIMRATSC